MRNDKVYYQKDIDLYKAHIEHLHEELSKLKENYNWVCDRLKQLESKDRLKQLESKDC